MWHRKSEPGTLRAVDYHQAAGGGFGGGCGACFTRRALKILHLTTMYYDSEEENSSASASDCEGEFDDENIDDNDNDDARSSAPFGENLRVRS